jgi:hypothetical protein
MVEAKLMVYNSTAYMHACSKTDLPTNLNIVDVRHQSYELEIYWFF